MSLKGTGSLPFAPCELEVPVSITAAILGGEGRAREKERNVGKRGGKKRTYREKLRHYVFFT